MDFSQLLIAAGGGALALAFQWLLGFSTRRDEMRNALVLQTTEARLRVAAEARLRILERAMADAAAVRVAFNRVIAESHRFANEVLKRSGQEQAALDSLQESLRAIAVASGGFLPPELAGLAEQLLTAVQDVVDGLVRSRTMPRDEMHSEHQRLDGRIGELAEMSREAFGAWWTRSWDEQDRILGDLASTPKAIRA